MKHRNHRTSRTPCTAESLERRVLLCALHTQPEPPPNELRPDLVGVDSLAAGPEGGAANIVWVNRGNASDGFAAVFGAGAAAARAVVDQVILEYERMITSFNYSDGSTNFDLTVAVGGTGLGGGASTTDTLGGKPKEGSLSLGGGNNGAGSGWFIDPTPAEHEEFTGNIVNAFAGDAQFGSAAFGLSDFYTVAAAEIAHCLGLGTDTSLWNNRISATGVTDNAEGGGVGTFRAFSGPSIQHLLSSNNAGGGGSDFGRGIHTAGPTANINFNAINWRGADDAGNVSYEGSRRYLVPDVLGLMFADAYSYSIAPVGTRDTFHSVFNPTTGTLLISGGEGASPNSNDSISLNLVAGSVFRVTVDVGNDVPGTGSLPGTGNLPAYSALYDANVVQQIVLNSGDGNDSININFVDSLNPITIDAGSGNDTINFAQSTGNMDNVLGLNLTVNGNIGSDTLNLFDTANTRNDGFTVTSLTVARVFLNVFNYSGFEGIAINAGSGSSTFNINGLAVGTALTVNAGNGNDTMNVGNGNLNNVPSAITLNGQGGTDTITLNDASSTISDNYIVTSTQFQHTGFGPMNYGTVETVNLNASSGSNAFTIDTTSAGTTWVINAGNGNDSASIAFGFGNLQDVAGAVDFRGDAGTDSVTMWDDLSSQSDGTTVGATSIVHSGFGGLTYATLENLTINCASGNNPIDIVSTASGCTTTINGRDGNDTFNVTIFNGNLNGAAGAIVFNGGNGTDTGTLWDDLISTAHNYTVTSSAITRSGFGGFTYGTIEGLTLQASSGNNSIAVNSSIAATPITIDANGGSDMFNIAQAGGNLNAIAGALTLTGDTGTDTVVLFDSSSADSDGYTFNGLAITNTGFTSPTLATIEGITLHASTGGNLIEVSSTTAGVPLVINGNGGDDTLRITFATGNLGNAPAGITFSGGTGADDAVLWDDLVADSDAYTISSGAVANTGFGGFNYNNTVEIVTINGASGNNIFNINATGVGTLLSLNGNNGNDTFNVAAGDIDNQILGNVGIGGGAGTDPIIFNDTTDGLGSDIYTIQSSSLNKLTGGTTTWSNVESITVNGSNNADLYEIVGTSATAPLMINAGNGNDQFQLSAIGTGNLNNLPGAMTLNGQAGTADTITVHDSGSIVNDNYTLSATQLTHPSFGGMTYATVEGITLNCSSGANVIDISTAASCPVMLNAANGTDTINVNETAASAPATILPSTGNDPVRVNQDGIGSASAIFNATQRIGALTVGNGGLATLTAGGSKVLTMSSLSITGGVLNATDNDLIVDYTGATPLATIRNLLASGFNAGAWNGGGINSTSAAAAGNTALGIAEATDLFTTFPATFSGHSIDNTSVLIKYTLYGDTNLSGGVDLDDFNALASSFGQSARRWIHGDSDFDNDVDLDDFNRLAGNFGLGGLGPTSAASTSEDPVRLISDMMPA